MISNLITHQTPKVRIGSILKGSKGKYTVAKADYANSNPTPVLTANKSFILGYTNETTGVYPADVDNPVIIFDDFTTQSQWVDFHFKVKSAACAILDFVSDSEYEFDKKYVYYALNNAGFTPSAHMTHWNRYFVNMEIPLPPLEDQKRIASYLDELTSVIDSSTSLQQEAIQLLKQEKTALWSKIFDITSSTVLSLGGKRIDTGNWAKTTLSDVADLVGGVSFSPADKSLEETSIVVLPADNVDLLGTVSVVKPIYLKENFSVDKRCQLVPGDILMSMASGSLTHVGKTGLVNDSTFSANKRGNYYAGGFMSIVRAKSMDPVILEMLLRGPTTRKWIANNATGITLKNISKASKIVPLPEIPVEHQAVISEYFSQLDSQIRLAAERLDLLHEQKAAYNGRISSIFAQAS